jgi:hypothetical protein
MMAKHESVFVGPESAEQQGIGFNVLTARKT